MHEHNLNIVNKVRPSKDPIADELAWSKSEKEFATGGLLGPWHCLSQIPWPLFRLLHRFIIGEQHGGQDWTVRCIDDALLGGHHDFPATTACHCPCYLDTWVAFLRVVASWFAEPIGSDRE